MPNECVRRVPKGGRKEARSRTFWSRITPTMLRDFQDTKGSDRLGSEEQYAQLVAAVRHLNDKKVPDHWRAG